MGLDVYGLLQLLSLPRQLRTTNAYASKMISLVPFSSVKTIPVTAECIRKNAYDLSWLQISKANFGLELQWVPHKPTGWFVEYVGNAVKFAVGFVPLIGTLLQVGFALGWTALIDPDRFMDVLQEEVPGLVFTIRIVDLIKEDIEKTREYMPAGWAENGKMLQAPPDQIKGDVGKDADMDGLVATYIIAKTGKVLDKSGGVPTPAADQEDVEEVMDGEIPTPAADQEDVEEVLDATLIGDASDTDAKWLEYSKQIPPGSDMEKARKAWDAAQKMIAEMALKA